LIVLFVVTVVVLFYGCSKDSALTGSILVSSLILRLSATKIR